MHKDSSSHGQFQYIEFEDRQLKLKKEDEEMEKKHEKIKRNNETRLKELRILQNIK